MIKHLCLYAVLLSLSLVAHAQYIDQSEIDKIANTSLKDFVAEGQKKFGVKAAVDLKAVPIHPALNGSGVRLIPDMVKEFSSGDKEWITKDMLLSTSAREDIINAKIIYALKRSNGSRLGKEAYILPTDENGRDERLFDHDRGGPGTWCAGHGACSSQAGCDHQRPVEGLSHCGQRESLH